MKDVFISFSSKETAEAIQVCELLEQNHISCFISTRDLVPGREYAEQLVQNIDEVKAVILLLSNNSNNSPHVLREIEYAVSHKVPILVHALEEVSLSKSMEYYLMTHQWITNTADRDQKFRHRGGKLPGSGSDLLRCGGKLLQQRARLSVRVHPGGKGCTCDRGKLLHRQQLQRGCRGWLRHLPGEGLSAVL